MIDEDDFRRLHACVKAGFARMEALHGASEARQDEREARTAAQIARIEAWRLGNGRAGAEVRIDRLERQAKQQARQDAAGRGTVRAAIVAVVSGVFAVIAAIVQAWRS